MLRFSNSDPILIATFLYLLRDSFELEEDKFRVCLHLHEYHVVSRQRKFWSDITDIPEKQLLKIYRKPNTGRRKKRTTKAVFQLGIMIIK